LTDIEAFINKEIQEVRLEGFEAFRPRVPKKDAPPKPVVPVFGRRVKRYSNRL